MIAVGSRDDAWSLAMTARALQCLSDAGVDVPMFSQSFSEHALNLVVRELDQAHALNVLEMAFNALRAAGAITSRWVSRRRWRRCPSSVCRDGTPRGSFHTRSRHWASTARASSPWRKPRPSTMFRSASRRIRSRIRCGFCTGSWDWKDEARCKGARCKNLAPCIRHSLLDPEILQNRTYRRPPNPDPST